MKVHVCVHCKKAAITSRRKDFYCKDCGAVMLKLPLEFEKWWQMNLTERQEEIERFSVEMNGSEQYQN